MVTVEAVNLNLRSSSDVRLILIHFDWRAIAYFTILMFYQRTKVMTQVQI